jgi:hypothetical protein
MQELPAWIVALAGVAHPAQVLAIAQSALFTPPPAIAGPGSAGAVTLADDRTLQVRVIGKAPGDGPCQANYEVHAYESDQAVALVAREIPKPSTTTTTATAPVVCSSAAYSQILTTTIERPLGNRVAIDGTTRAPLAVTSASGRSG